MYIIRTVDLDGNYSPVYYRERYDKEVKCFGSFSDARKVAYELFEKALDQQEIQILVDAKELGSNEFRKLVALATYRLGKAYIETVTVLR